MWPLAAQSVVASGMLSSIASPLVEAVKPTASGQRCFSCRCHPDVQDAGSLVLQALNNLSDEQVEYQGARPALVCARPAARRSRHMICPPISARKLSHGARVVGREFD